MQISHFPGGGFVIHKAIDGKTSAWFDQDGTLLDAEFRDAIGRTRPVADNCKRWKELQAIGKRIASQPRP